MKTCACGNVFEPKTANQYSCSLECGRAFSKLRENTKSFTKDDLQALKLEYRANFEKLMDAFGTDEHKKYVLIERRLNHRENLMRGFNGRSHNV